MAFPRKSRMLKKAFHSRWGLSHPKTKDDGGDAQIKELVTWQNTAIAIFATNYIAFVAVLFFISSIIISTSDFDILLDSKLPLPVVSGQVNVRGFYFVCPWVIAILHANLLAKFESILSRGHFLDEELSKLKDKTLAKRFRYSVVGGIHFIFPEGVVIGDVLAHLCATIFMASLFVGPMLLLVFFEWRFLVYHSTVITWSQLAALWVFCLVSWSFWRRRELVQLFLGNTRFSRVAYLAFGSAGPCLVLLVAVLLAIPVRSASSPWSTPPWSWIPDAILFSSNDVRSWDTLTSVGHLLFETRRINLAGAIVAPPEAKTELVSADLCENLSTTQSFRSVELLDRDLRGINFGGARILGLNFGRGTNLEGANFEKATLVKSSFEHSSLLSSSFRDACLTDVKAAFANFNSPDWIGAQVTKSHFEYARFHFSNLTENPDHAHPDDFRRTPGSRLAGSKIAGRQRQGHQVAGRGPYPIEIKGRGFDASQDNRGHHDACGIIRRPIGPGKVEMGGFFRIRPGIRPVRGCRFVEWNV